MDMSYDAFIYLQDNLPPDSTIFIWRIIYASNDPFVQSIRDKSATSYSGLSQVVVEQFFRTDVVETLRNGNMPLDLWISFLVEYKELLLKNNDQVEQLNPSIKIFLRERFLDRINPVLSCKIKEEEIGKLLEETNFVVKDPLFDLASVGSHKPSVRTVRLSHQLYWEMVLRTIHILWLMSFYMLHLPDKLLRVHHTQKDYLLIQQHTHNGLV